MNCLHSLVGCSGKLLSWLGIFVRSIGSFEDCLVSCMVLMCRIDRPGCIVHCRRLGSGATGRGRRGGRWRSPGRREGGRSCCFPVYKLGKFLGRDSVDTCGMQHCT